MYGLSDIAKEIGVSVSQVSRALSNQERVSRELREKALECALRHNYRNTSIQHQLRVAVIYQQTKTGLDLRIPLFSMQKAFKKSAFKSMLFSFENVDFLSEFIFDAILALNVSEEKLEELKKGYKIPVVAVNMFGQIYKSCSCVVPDAESGIRLATEHLWSLGYDKVGCLGYSPIKTTEVKIGNLKIPLYSMKYSAEEKTLDELCKKYNALILLTYLELPYLVHLISKQSPQVALVVYNDYSELPYMKGLTAHLEFNVYELFRQALKQLHGEYMRCLPKRNILLPTKLRCKV